MKLSVLKPEQRDGFDNIALVTIDVRTFYRARQKK